MASGCILSSTYLNSVGTVVAFGFLSGFFLGVGLSFSGAFLLFFPRGAVDTRLEPWTGLHCSELYWRCPVELSAVQSRAPASSKVCQHGSVR